MFEIDLSQKESLAARLQREGNASIAYVGGSHVDLITSAIGTLQKALMDAADYESGRRAIDRFEAEARGAITYERAFGRLRTFSASDYLAQRKDELRICGWAAGEKGIILRHGLLTSEIVAATESAITHNDGVITRAQVRGLAVRGDNLIDDAHLAKMREPAAVRSQSSRSISFADGRVQELP